MSLSFLCFREFTVRFTCVFLSYFGAFPVLLEFCTFSSDTSSSSCIVFASLQSWASLLLLLFSVSGLLVGRPPGFPLAGLGLSSVHGVAAVPAVAPPLFRLLRLLYPQFCWLFCLLWLLLYPLLVFRMLRLRLLIPVFLRVFRMLRFRLLLTLLVLLLVSCLMRVIRMRFLKNRMLRFLRLCPILSYEFSQDAFVYHRFVCSGCGLSLYASSSSCFV